jgi:hypothetical protein
MAMSRIYDKNQERKTHPKRCYEFSLGHYIDEKKRLA